MAVLPHVDPRRADRRPPTRRPHRRAALMLGLTSLLVVATATGCASDGRELQPASGAGPVPIATLPPSSGPMMGPLPGASALRSDAFTDGQRMPVSHTCDGTNVSPALDWNAIPVGTLELALAFTDPDAGGFVHWVIANLPADLTALASGAVPAGAVQARNGFGDARWSGPCPPEGDGLHHYAFTLYGLIAPSGITASDTGAEAVAKLEQAAYTVKLTLSATYSRDVAATLAGE